MKRVALCLALILSGCVVVTDQPVVRTPLPEAAAPPPAAPAARAAKLRPIVIHNDKGGNVMQMLARRRQLETSGRPVEIRGYCRSACTMLITMANACLGPHATVGFHAPRLPGSEVIPPLVPDIMASTYRAGIRAKWDGGWNRSIDMVKISARDYVALDPQTRLCD